MPELLLQVFVLVVVAIGGMAIGYNYRKRIAEGKYLVQKKPPRELLTKPRNKLKQRKEKHT